MAASDRDHLAEELATVESQFLKADRMAAELPDDDISDDAFELRAQLETARRRLRELKEKLARRPLMDPVEWYKTQYRWERRRARRLELELLEERRRAWTFTDDAVA